MQQPHDNHDALTDERVDLFPVFFGAISEIELDTHADLNADYDLEYPQAAFYPDCCHYCGTDLDIGYLSHEDGIPGTTCSICGEFIPDEIEED